MSWLHIKTGPRAGERIEIEQELVIGRVDADVVIDDAEVSRRHLVVRPLAGALEVEDLGSTTGTFVEGARIDGPTRLVSGTIVKLGATELEVEAIAAQSASVSPVADVNASPVADVNATRVHQFPIGAAATAPGPSTADLAAASHPIAEAAVPASPEAASAAGALAPTAPAPAPAAGRPGEPPQHSPAPVVASSHGAFAPPSSKRGRGLNSRSWVPVALSFGTMIVTAVALVIYFAAR